MKKFSALLALLCLLSSQTAHATQLISDTALTANPITSMGTNWSFVTGKLVGAGVTGTRAAIAVSVPAGTRIRYSVHTANVSAGSLRVVVGSPAMTSTGANVPVTDGTNGETAIPDTFTTSLGLYTGAETHAADSSPEGVGAFRFWCQGGFFGRFDPLLQHSVKGGSHGHKFNMNTGVTPNTIYRSLRRSGGTTCGNNRYPVQHSGYWTPWMLNGQGAIVMPFAEQFYYKGWPVSYSVCAGAPSATRLGICVPIPNGLRYVAGYNMVTMTGGPTDAAEASKFVFACRVKDSAGWGDVPAGMAAGYPTIAATVAAGCGANRVLFVSMEGPSCWNGTQVDTVNHKSHVAYPGTGTLGVDYWNVSIPWTLSGVAQTPESGPSCPTSHPYKIPVFAWQQFFLTDASFAAGKWRLSADEAMTTEVAAGTTLHMDYWEGWSPTWKAMWQAGCIDGHRSCSGGIDGIGNAFLNPATAGPGSPTQLTYRPLPRTGESRPLAGNGTFTGELVALTGDSIYLYSPDGFTGEVLDWSMQTITPVNVRNGVTHHTVH